MFPFVFYLVFLFLFFFLFFIFFMKSFLLDFYFFSYGGLDFNLVFVFDFVSLSFFSCVSFISGTVFLYSLFYMSGTVDMRRFFLLVSLFVVSMFFLVFSGNFFLTMVGWDGLGLVSFLLVVFYSNSSSLESGLITVFSNRLGDVFFLLSFLFFYLSGSSSFDFFSYDFLCFFVFLVFFGSITKSAQVPFSAWLPAAMAAPTPVSSLVHSSTLVTAGVYVLIRFNYIFFYYDFFFMKFLFLFTMVLAGFCAVLEKDFKKVVAMSTLSQLGMMVFVLSIGLWVLSFIHMIIHAFFKSMLFLSTGSMMSQVSGLQDSRFYGGVHFSFGSFVYFVVSCFCLSGFPFFVGFYSKDFIISSSSSFSGTLYYYVFIIGCLFTVFYSIRLVYEGFINTFSSFSFMGLKESSYFFIPVMFLFFNCWLLGGMFYWVFLVDLTFFFLWSDLLLGVVLIFVGGFLTFYLSFSYYLSFSFFSILFLRWGFNGGTSFFNKSFFLAGFESTWMEVFGGMGTYRSFLNLNCFLFSLEMLSLGLVIFVSFVVLFFLFLV